MNTGRQRLSSNQSSDNVIKNKSAQSDFEFGASHRDITIC